MNPTDPKQNPLIPAVEHLMGSLDSDAQGVQRIADKLVGAVGDSLISDKNYLQKRVKARLPRMVGNSIRRDERVINDIAGRLRQAVASSLVSDAEGVDQIAGRLQSAGLSVPVASAPAVATATATVGTIGQCPTDPGDGYSYVYIDNPGGIRWVVDPTDPRAVPLCQPAPPAEPPASPPGYDLFGWAQNCCQWAYRRWIGTPGVPSVPPALPPVPAVPPPGGCPPCAPGSVPVVPADGAPPATVSAVVPCGPLPEGLPAVAVYVVPWLDPGDHAASYLSDCGTKMIRERQWTRKDAGRLAEALVSMDALDAWLPAAPEYSPEPDPFIDDGPSGSAFGGFLGAGG